MKYIAYYASIFKNEQNKSFKECDYNTSYFNLC